MQSQRPIYKKRGIPTRYFYAVHKGHAPGVYTSWAETLNQISNFKGAVHKKFLTMSEAQHFVVTGQHKLPQHVNTQTADWEKKEVHCWTDGSCIRINNKPFYAGSGVFFGINSAFNIAQPFMFAPLTNQRAELYAVILALESCQERRVPADFKVFIHIDSQYAMNCCSHWLPGWLSNNWKTSNGGPVSNRDLLERLAVLLKLWNVQFIKVKAHANDYGNEQADKLAKEGAEYAKKMCLVPREPLQWNVVDQDERFNDAALYGINGQRIAVKKGDREERHCESDGGDGLHPDIPSGELSASDTGEAAEVHPV